MGASLVQMRQVLGPYEQVVAAFSRLGLPSRRIGTAPYGLDIYAYRVGEAGPTGMVTAGAHAEEVAGVATAYSLAARFQPGLQGWIVPCRDPLGWDGFRRNLARAVGRPVRIRSHHDVVELIKREGEPILLGDVTVGIIDQVAFFSLADSHPGNDDTGVFAHAFLSERDDVRERLLGKRVFVPGSPKLTQERDVYDWGGGPTIYVDADGRVGNFNRFFAAENPPVEVQILRAFADEVRPRWTLDLHEGFGASYCLYALVGESSVGKDAAKAMVDAVSARGYPIQSLKELAAYVGMDESAFEEIYPGVYQANRRVRRPPDAFCPYVGQMGSLCFTTEMGMESPLDVRMEILEVSARACLEVLTRLEG